MHIDEVKPVPIVSDDLDARSYHDIELDVLDPRASEALVDIGSYGIAIVPYYHLSDGSNPPYRRRVDGSLPRIWCRESLIPMLQSANDTLSKHRVELVVFDAYRPISAQRGLWAWALQKVAADHPGLQQAELEALTSQYSSDPRRFNPDDATTWPTHSTGASIDVVLRDLDTGEQLDMGTAFDDHFERELRAGRIAPDNTALFNRRLLYWAMTSAGFANYPSEYWHFDFGNQMYVLNSRTEPGSPSRAWYGYCMP